MKMKENKNAKNYKMNENKRTKNYKMNEITF